MQFLIVLLIVVLCGHTASALAQLIHMYLHFVRLFMKIISCNYNFVDCVTHKNILIHVLLYSQGMECQSELCKEATKFYEKH